MKTLLFYVLHLLGIGHVLRATRVARALANAGAAPARLLLEAQDARHRASD